MNSNWEYVAQIHVFVHGKVQYGDKHRNITTSIFFQFMFNKSSKDVEFHHRNNMHTYVLISM